VQEAMPPAARPFIHMCGEQDLLPGAVKNADILFQTGAGPLTTQMLATKGRHVVTLDGELPPTLKPGQIDIRYGLYDPADGRRLEMDGPSSGDGRYDGGTLTITGEGAATKIAWTPPAPRAPTRANTLRKVVEFGPVATNLAFRLTKGAEQMELTLLPYSPAGTVTLHLDKLGAAGAVKSIEQIDLEGKVVAPVTPTVRGRDATFETVARAFRYRVTLG